MLKRSNLKLTLGISAAVATHALFAVLVWKLFFFLRDGRPASEHGSWVVNSLLALGFALPHSALLHPRVKKVLGRWITPAFYGLFYCASTCISLLVVFYYWRGCGPVLWQASGWTATLIAAGFYSSWAGLFYSLSLTGVGYQTGLTPWLYWLLGETIPRRDFTPRGAYKILRHPVYLTFMGLVWFTPTMTADHAVLTGIWTAYLFVGSWLKDERLAFYLGEKYRTYQTQVAGYPGMLFGPLARMTNITPSPTVSRTSSQIPTKSAESLQFPAEISNAA